MTDLQILTIALAIIVPISSLIHSNLRVTDAKDAVNKRLDGLDASLNQRMNALDASLNKRLDETKETLRAEMRTMQSEILAEMRAGFERIENAIKVHELEHHRG